MIRVRIVSLLAVVATLTLSFLLGRVTAHVGDRATVAAPRRSLADDGLMRAVQADDGPLARLLLHRGSDPNARDDMGLPLVEWALAGQHAEVAGILLDAGARADLAFDMEAAVARRDWSTVDVLIQHHAPAPADRPNHEGSTPLLLAAADSQASDLIPFLVQNGADVNARDSKGNTPLILLAAQRLEDAVLATLFDLFRKHGADFSAANSEGKTALMAAAEADDEGAVRLLLARGADPQRRDRAGYTAREYADDRDGGSAVRHLLAAMK